MRRGGAWTPPRRAPKSPLDRPPAVQAPPVRHRHDAVPVTSPAARASHLRRRRATGRALPRRRPGRLNAQAANLRRRRVPPPLPERGTRSRWRPTRLHRVSQRPLHRQTAPVQVAFQQVRPPLPRRRITGSSCCAPPVVFRSALRCPVTGLVVERRGMPARVIHVSCVIIQSPRLLRLLTLLLSLQLSPLSTGNVTPPLPAPRSCGFLNEATGHEDAWLNIPR